MVAAGTVFVAVLADTFIIDRLVLKFIGVVATTLFLVDDDDDVDFVVFCTFGLGPGF
jgi:hypothetical protein